MFLIFALNSTAAASGTAATTGGLTGTLPMLISLGLMFVLLYFIMIRPQRKKEKEMRELIGSMTVGDKCVTAGGVVGRVVNIKDDEVTIQTSVANTLITFKKSSISSVVKPISGDE